MSIVENTYLFMKSVEKRTIDNIFLENDVKKIKKEGTEILFSPFFNIVFSVMLIHLI
jgi:hypothetical protein